MSESSGPKLRLRDIDFGMSSAENERLEKPELLREGFYDLDGCIERIIQEQVFLVLGPKGSGKSAIGARLELLSDIDAELHSRAFMLQDFPYKSFAGILPGKESHEVRLPRHWEFVLLLALLDSYRSDETCTANFSEETEKLISGLETSGILPVSDLKSIVKNTNNSKFKARIPKILEYERNKQTEAIPNLDAVHEALRKVAYGAKPENRHIIVIDGLDDVLTSSTKQYQSIAALIVATDRINRSFKQHGSKAKFVLLCRSDLFDSLDDPNTNKIKQDHAVELIWMVDDKKPEDSHLVQLVNMRAELTTGQPTDVFRDFLPKSAFKRTTLKVILENTRYRPRDLTQALNYIGRVSSTAKALSTHVESGLKNYAKQYFVPEAKNELCGFLPKEETGYILQLLQLMKRDKFSFKELDMLHQKNKTGRFEDSSLLDMCRALFEIGIIGQSFKEELHGGRYIQFRHRNPYAEFNPNHSCVLHLALATGLNIPMGAGAAAD